MSRVRHAGATGPLTRRADRGCYTHAIVAVCRDKDLRFSSTVRPHSRLRNLSEAIPETDWTPLSYWMDGAADVAETTYVPFESKSDATPVRLIVRRVQPTPGSQLALFVNYSYYGFITDRDGDTLELEADQRGHAEIENAIRDLKYGVGLNHLPSGRFAANGAWLAVQVMAHNLARWTARIGLGEQVDHQDPAAALLRPGRTAHPLGPPPHPASSPGLALGKPVRQSLGQTAGPAISSLTASDPSAALLNRLTDPRRPVPDGLRLRSALIIASYATTTRRQHPLGVAATPRTQPIHWSQSLTAPFPPLSALVRPARSIPSVDSGSEVIHRNWQSPQSRRIHAARRRTRRPDTLATRSNFAGSGHGCWLTETAAPWLRRNCGTTQELASHAAGVPTGWGPARTDAVGAPSCARAHSAATRRPSWWTRVDGRVAGQPPDNRFASWNRAKRVGGGGSRVTVMVAPCQTFAEAVTAAGGQSAAGPTGNTFPRMTFTLTLARAVAPVRRDRSQPIVPVSRMGRSCLSTQAFQLMGRYVPLCPPLIAPRPKAGTVDAGADPSPGSPAQVRPPGFAAARRLRPVSVAEWWRWRGWSAGHPPVPLLRKTKFQLYLAATVANLTLVLGKIGRSGSRWRRSRH